MTKEDSNLRYAIVVVGAVTAGISAAALLAWNRVQSSGPPSHLAVEHDADSAGSSQFVDKLVLARQQLDETVWSDEVTAQKYEEPFVRLWDQLRASSDKYDVLASFPFETLILKSPANPQQHELNVQSAILDQDRRELTPEQWKQFLQEMKADGYELIQSEWHHSRFDTGHSGRRSVVSMKLHVQNKSKLTLHSIEGDLLIQWAADQVQPKIIEVGELRMLSRRGESLFDEAIVLEQGNLDSNFLSVMMTLDLNGDGLSEIVLPSSNAVYWNRGNWNFERGSLFDESAAAPVFCGLFADFSGHGRMELLGASHDGLTLFSQNDEGRFSMSTGKTIALSESLVNPMAMTAGDIDADGDLDVWIGQYKNPYTSGQMPTPYYDANDGHPAFLLRNQGEGDFADVTEHAGLAAKRFRRTYSAAFADLDADNDLDLAVASDFSGLDVYKNDGSGQFSDATADLMDDRHSFGMALTFGDYDLNTKPDFMMIGMSSTTARRLDQLGLGREEFPEHQTFRRQMAYGNRMYLAGESGFQQAPFNDQIARTGWSWGASSFDFDNDGDRDVYIANGHMSGDTARDYCTRFWCHDIYTANSLEDVQIENFFATTMAKEQNPISWNGFEHNVLLSNQQGEGFLNIGFLAGVATEFDSRNVTTDDLDGDGRMDIVVVARESRNKPFAVHVFRNRLQNDANWIGVRLNQLPCSGLGAQVNVRTPGRTFSNSVVCGDSLKSQHAAVVHFGLGAVASVDEIVIQWPGAKPVRIENPTINRYHVAVPNE